MREIGGGGGLSCRHALYMFLEKFMKIELSVVNNNDVSEIIVKFLAQSWQKQLKHICTLAMRIERRCRRRRRRRK